MLFPLCCVVVFFYIFDIFLIFFVMLHLTIIFQSYATILQYFLPYINLILIHLLLDLTIIDLRPFLTLSTKKNCLILFYSLSSKKTNPFIHQHQFFLIQYRTLLIRQSHSFIFTNSTSLFPLTNKYCFFIRGNLLNYLYILVHTHSSTNNITSQNSAQYIVIVIIIKNYIQNNVYNTIWFSQYFCRAYIS